jgi:hypothetical protein
MLPSEILALSTSSLDHRPQVTEVRAGLGLGNQTPPLSPQPG